VHNVLEPAVWGKPVVFGPIYDKYREATALIAAGGGFSVETTLELEKCLLRLLTEPVTAGLAARNYIERHAGATQRIVRYIQEKRLLTS
jgi:3-deoxy-D-manno-octulosonic-acid transferase